MLLLWIKWPRSKMCMKKASSNVKQTNAHQHPPKRSTGSMHAFEEGPPDMLVFQSIELHNVTLEKGTQLHATINFALKEGGKHAQPKGKIDTGAEGTFHH